MAAAESGCCAGAATQSCRLVGKHGAYGKVRKMIGIGQPLKLREFSEKRVMEVYANDGAAALFTTVDAEPEDWGMEAFSHGGVGKMEWLKAWNLKPAGFSLEKFQV